MLVLCALVLALAYPLQQYFSQGSQIDQLKQQNADKRAEVSQLQQQLAQWQDPDYVKIQARLRLHYVFPGETGLRLLGAGDAASGGPDGTTGPSQGSSAWYAQLWNSVTAATGAPPSATSAPRQCPLPCPRRRPATEAPLPHPGHGVTPRYFNTASTRRWSSSAGSSPSFVKMLLTCFSTAPVADDSAVRSRR